MLTTVEIVNCKTRILNSTFLNGNEDEVASYKTASQNWNHVDGMTRVWAYITQQ